jgi:hypothetical protein
MTSNWNQFFKFLLVFQGLLLDAIWMHDVMQHVGRIHSLPKEKIAKYRWRTHSRWQFALISVVSSNETTYEKVVSVPTEEHNRYV